MKNYSEMSNFEINKAVGEITFDGRWACKPGFAGNDSESWYYGSVDTFVTPYPSLPDYCNSWADAGPIIKESRISLRNRIDGSWMAENEWGMSFRAIHDNPLRAAMIVFLMMQESK